jgi:hypothetical protein
MSATAIEPIYPWNQRLPKVTEFSLRVLCRRCRSESLNWKLWVLPGQSTRRDYVTGPRLRTAPMTAREAEHFLRAGLAVAVARPAPRSSTGGLR